MGAAYFYHLTDTPLDMTLPMLLDKAVGAGWRVLVRAPDAALLDRLDQTLWTDPADSFRAHGVAGGPHDAGQPVLLAQDHAADGFDCIMCVGGANVTAAEVNAAQRVCILFDGQDGDAVQLARGQWKALTGADCAAQYWAQEDSRWVKKAESGG